MKSLFPRLAFGRFADNDKYDSPLVNKARGAPVEDWVTGINPLYSKRIEAYHEVFLSGLPWIVKCLRIILKAGINDIFLCAMITRQ